MPAQTVIQPRRGTAALWTSTNPILADGEMGYETNTKQFKLGDGSTLWNALAYVGADKAALGHTHVASNITDSTATGRSVLTAVDAAAARTAIGAGTSSLIIGTSGTTAKAGNWVPNFSEITGIISTAQMPPIAINETFPVATEAAMLALTAQRGDVAIRSDVNKSFILSTDNPGTLADWLELLSTSAVTSVAGRTGAVTLTKTDVGLANVDNTSDAAKPVSTATNTALGLKANLASPTFTGTPTLPSGTLGLTKTTVGLSNVDNTSDAAKPVSTATNTALAGKANSTHTHTSADIVSIDGGSP